MCARTDLGMEDTLPDALPLALFVGLRPPLCGFSTLSPTKHTLGCIPARDPSPILEKQLSLLLLQMFLLTAVISVIIMCQFKDLAGEKVVRRQGSALFRWNEGESPAPLWEGPPWIVKVGCLLGCRTPGLHAGPLVGIGKEERWSPLPSR